MSKGLRIFLHVLQVLTLLGALLYLAFTHLEAYADWGLSEQERAYAPFWAITCAVLSIAFSPSLWSLHRGAAAASAAPAMGSYDRVPEQPPPGQQPPPPPPQRPGGVGFEPMSPDRAPAPPASSYSQQPGNFPGGTPQAGGMPPASPPQGETPWGKR